MRVQMPRQLQNEQDKIVHDWVHSNEKVELEDYFKREASPKLLSWTQKREEYVNRMHEKGIIVD